MHVIGPGALMREQVEHQLLLTLRQANNGVGIADSARSEATTSKQKRYGGGTSEYNMAGWRRKKNTRMDEKKIRA